MTEFSFEFENKTYIGRFQKVDDDYEVYFEDPELSTLPGFNPIRLARKTDGTLSIPIGNDLYNRGFHKAVRDAMFDANQGNPL